MKTFRLPLGLALLFLLAVGPALADAGGSPLVDHVRAANDRFKDVAVAVAEGYGPIPCASSAQGGAMGVHYVNGESSQGWRHRHRKTGSGDVSDADGKMNLVAVEYIAFKGPAALEGHLFNFNSAPNRYGLDPFYELHVWAWKPNSTGHFADNNPEVSCNAAKLNSQTGAGLRARPIITWSKP